MATEIMVKDLSPEGKKALKTQLKIEKDVLKRLKRKSDYLNELDNLWGSRDAWLPPKYRGNRKETPGLNILVSLRSISHKAARLGIPLSSL